MPAVVLETVLKGCDAIRLRGRIDLVLKDIAYDSREASPGGLFFCMPGFNFDGHEFISEALARGAKILVVERDVEIPADADVTVIQVPDMRLAMALISAAFYSHPSSKLNLVGVTGTNGKTSIAFLVDELNRETGLVTGMLGTVENRIANEKLTVKRTTPESMDLQDFLARMVKVGCTHTVMEVSSHALALKRVEGCKFSYAIFTNLTIDHLDFHPDMEDYFNAKLKLFTDSMSEGGVAITNMDDEYGRRIAEKCTCRVVGYGVKSEDATVRATNVKCTRDGIAFSVVSPYAETFEVESPLMGMFNVYNSLAMIAYGLDNKISVDAIKSTLKRMHGVPGRFERVDAGQKFGVYCDYAHTPNGLENILASAREICDGRLFCVFGCGGDRDRTKRPIMGAVVTRLADVAVVTQDNSRTEPPDRIIDQIVQGIEQEMTRIDPSRQFKLVVEPDRFLAIKYAIQNAVDGDVVIIAGKGAETYQIFKDRTIHFDDREVSMNILRELVSGVGNDA